MSHYTHVESGIYFNFPHECQVLRYDKCNFYINKLMPIQETEAVDFVLCAENVLTLMEVMHYKEEPFHDTKYVIEKASHQFYDTIAGLALCHICKEKKMEAYSNALFSDTKIANHIILFLELAEIAHNRYPKNKILADVQQKLKTLFVPLGFAVRVFHTENIQNAPWKAYK